MIEHYAMHAGFTLFGAIHMAILSAVPALATALSFAHRALGTGFVAVFEKCITWTHYRQSDIVVKYKIASGLIQYGWRKIVNFPGCVWITGQPEASAVRLR